MFEKPTVQKLKTAPDSLARPIFTWVNQSAGVDQEAEGLISQLRNAADVFERAKKAFPDTLPEGQTYITKDQAAAHYRQALHGVKLFFSAAWSQGAPETHWTPEDVEGLIPLLGLAGALQVMRASVAQITQFLKYAERVS